MVLGVSGGIAAYKASELLRLLTESGHDVTVVPTQAALQFVGQATWEALSGKPVAHDVWSNVPAVQHVRLGQQADLVVVAPTTADLMAKLAHGRADDLLTATLLTATCPVVLAPAMHTEMWQHPATVANVATLRERGVRVLDPASGRLTGVDTGPGRLPEAAALFGVCQAILAAGSRSGRDLVGKRILISGGGTREPLDPVRYLGNRSSGRQAWALAATAVARGADVTLVAANVDLPDPAGVNVHRVSSSHELDEQMTAELNNADVVVMAAAVADFEPTNVADQKIKKTDDGSSPSLQLQRTPDVLSNLGSLRTGAAPLLVGFAAETVAADDDPRGRLIELAQGKARRKGADFIVGNSVDAGHGFESSDNAVVIVTPDAVVAEVPLASKEAISHELWDVVVTALSKRSDPN